MRYYGTISDNKDLVTKEYVDNATGSSVTFDTIYPIGSIYMSVNNTDPGTLFAGTTWTRIQDTFLLAAGSTYTAGSTGGSATVTLTSAQSGVPAHNHGSSGLSVGGGATTNAGTNTDGSWAILNAALGARTGSTGTFGNASNTVLSSSGTTRYKISNNNYTTSLSNMNDKLTYNGHTHKLVDHSHTVSGSVANNTAADASAAHDNMPPYLTVYMWQRTS